MALETRCRSTWRRDTSHRPGLSSRRATGCLRGLGVVLVLHHDSNIRCPRERKNLFLLRNTNPATTVLRPCSGRGAGPVGRGGGSLARVRLTAFWDHMRAQFGDAYAESVAKDHVIGALGGRTVNQALADGEDVKTVWRAVCDAFHLPERAR
jgi:hypothetical protein